MAPVDFLLDAAARSVGRTAFPNAAPATQEHQGRDRDPDLRRLLPVLRVGAHLGPDWGDSPIPWHLGSAGVARRSRDLRAARAATRLWVRTPAGDMKTSFDP